MVSLTQNLHQLQPILAMLFANSKEAVMLLDKNYHIILCSSAVAKIDGYCDDEILYTSFLALIIDSEKQKVMSLLQELSADIKQSASLQVTLNYPGRQPFLASLNLSANFAHHEQFIVVNVNVISHQITVQKPKLPNIKLGLLESVVANISDAVMILELDPAVVNDSKIIYVNKAFPIITGYTFNELQGHSPRFLQAALTDQTHLIQLRNNIYAGKAFENTLPSYKKNGELYWVNASFSPLKDVNDRLTNWIITLRDVTEKKELENVLRKASSLAGIGSWAYEPHSQKMFWSNMTKQIYEVKKDFNPDLSNTAYFFKHAKQNQAVLDQITSDINKGKAFDLEVEILTAKKNKKWIRIIGEPEIIHGNCQKISGSFQDIDQRKKAQLLAEKTIKEKNEIFESIADGFFAVDKKWKITFWSRRAAEEVKRNKEDLIHQNLWEVFSEAVGSPSYHQYQQAMKLKKPVQFESFSAVTAQWYDISAYPSHNGLSVYFRNITTRKEDKQLILATEKRYSDLFQLSPLPKWVFDIKTLRFLDVNKAAINHYGYSYKQFMKMTILDIRPLDEHEELKAVLAQPNSKQKFLHQGLFTHQKKNGELIRVNIQSVHFTFKGRKAKLIIAHDVTEQEKYIQAIEEQNQKLKEVSWINSHILRAPLTKILGLLEVAKIVDEHQERKVVLEYIQTAATELDKAILEITKRSQTNSIKG